MRFLAPAFVGLTLATALHAEEVRPLQELLADASCNPGPIDGMWGGRTERALRVLLRDSDLDIERPITSEDIAALQEANLSCPVPRTDLTLVDGPFNGVFRRVATTDVRELGCPDCAPTARILATPDLDGDGTSEILLSMESFDVNFNPTNVPIELAIFRADGQPYEGFVDTISRMHAREAAVADFNSDGLDDVFIAAHGQDGRPFPGENDALILSTSDGTHINASDSHLPYLESMSHGTAAGDIDNDGDVDILVFTNAGGGRSGLSNYVLLNQGDGRFELSRGDRHLPRQAQSANAFLTGTLVDVDQDGSLDLLLAGSGDDRQGNLMVIGNGDGTFSDPMTLPRPDWSTTTWTTDMDAEDIDGDGDRDLVLLHTGRFAGQRYKGVFVQILVNRGMTFTDETAFRMWPQVWDAPEIYHLAHNISFADLNRDGALDIVVQSLNPLWKDVSGDVPPHIGLNRGDGVFDPVSPDWPRTFGYEGRQLLPMVPEGVSTIAGVSLNGLNENDGFRPLGHHLQVLRPRP